MFSGGHRDAPCGTGGRYLVQKQHFPSANGTQRSYWHRYTGKYCKNRKTAFVSSVDAENPAEMKQITSLSSVIPAAGMGPPFYGTERRYLPTINLESAGRRGL